MREQELIVYKDFTEEEGRILYDMVFLMEHYKDDYYNKEAKMDNNISISEFIIAKHRNGPTTTIELLFKKNTSTFSNYMKEEEN